MDNATRETMRKEIVEASGDFGRAAGVGVFVVLGFLATLVPAIDRAMKSEDTWYWPLGVIAAIAIYVGVQLNKARKKNLEAQFTVWDDDGLKLAYDKMRESRILKKVSSYALLAVVALYFILR